MSPASSPGASTYGTVMGGGILGKKQGGPESTEHTELQNTTPTGRAPRRRLATPEAAFIIADQFDEADRQDAVSRAIRQGMIDGNPPYVQAELKEMGLDDITNVNFLTMRANLDARAAAAHELFMEVPTLMEFSPAGGEPTPDDHHAASVLSEELARTVMEWPQFHSSMDMVVRESDAHGLGFLVWPDKYDFRPKAFRRGTLRFDPEASVDVDANDIYIINDWYTAGQLYDKIEDPKIAELCGWKVDAVRELLVRTFIIGDKKEENKYNTTMWESVQQMVRNNDVNYQSKQFTKVSVKHLFVREVAAPRHVSHYIIPANSTKQVFLCEVPNEYETMSQALWWLPFNFGDGYARSVRGVASYMAPHDDLSNRFLCRLFDAGFLSSSLLLQPKAQADLSGLQFIQQGQFTIVPPGLEAIQSTFQPQIAPLLSLRQVSENVLQNNTGLYRQHPESIDNSAQKTARQVVEEVSKEARYEKAAVAHRYIHLDMLYREIMRRLTNPDYVNSAAPFPGQDEAKMFWKRVEDRGVDKKYLREWKTRFRLHATRALGLGSLGMRYDITNQLMGARAAFDETGQRNIVRDWTAARVGYMNTTKFVATLNRDKIPSNDSSIAMLENNDMVEGSQVVVGTDQLHKIHLDTHVPLLMQLIQAVGAGMVTDPTKALGALQQLIPHCAGHADQLRQDSTRQPFVKQIDQILAQAEGAFRTLQSQVQRMQAQQQKVQQEQQQLLQDAEQIKRDRDMEVKVMELQQKARLALMEQESLNAMRDQKTQEQMAIARSEAESRIRLAAEKQAAELEIARIRANADVQRPR